MSRDLHLPSVRRAVPAVVAGMLLIVSGSAGAAADSPAPARQRELIRMLVQDCGSCHGLRLTGGLGPPLTPAALQDRTDDMLNATVMSGRPGTAMPPWAPFLTEPESRWLIEQLRRGVERHEY